MSLSGHQRAHHAGDEMTAASDAGMARATIPLTTTAPERAAHSFGQFFDTGLLWYINRALFNPLGYALAIEGPRDAPLGWSLHHAGTPVSFDVTPEEEAEKLQQFQALLATAREHGVSPSDGGAFFAGPPWQATGARPGGSS